MHSNSKMDWTKTYNWKDITVGIADGSKGNTRCSECENGHVGSYTVRTCHAVVKLPRHASELVRMLLRLHGPRAYLSIY